jgi:hypothetical protein
MLQATVDKSALGVAVVMKPQASSQITSEAPTVLPSAIRCTPLFCREEMTMPNWDMMGSEKHGSYGPIDTSWIMSAMFSPDASKTYSIPKSRAE